MGELKDAIEQFQIRQLGVYKTDPGRLVRDKNSTARVVRDHINRWFFELFQNCDDASAEKVLVRVTADTIYVADDGKGLQPSAVEAISGTDFSDKPYGTIGRKGIGFKAVYDISGNPQVFTRNGEGLEFNLHSTVEWLSSNGLPTDEVPYQWIPFFIARSMAENADCNLTDLQGLSTIIKLPVTDHQKIIRACASLDWPSHALLPFNHVKTLQVETGEAGLSDFSIHVEADGPMRTILDSRKEAPLIWTVDEDFQPCPAEMLQTLDKDERRRIESDGLKFLVAAPVEEGGTVRSAGEYLPVHVFYPTEEMGPLRLLLHAEFLVKSDRTSLIPIQSSPFNTWITNQLAERITRFVQKAYVKERPSLFVGLLAPWKERESHSAAKSLWDHIGKNAKTSLKLPNRQNKLRLVFDKAKILGVEVEVQKARAILEKTVLRDDLLHPHFDTDDESLNTLRALGISEISDDDLLRIIEMSARSNAKAHDWVWACWEWLAAWVAHKPWGEEHKARLERARELPLIPTSGKLTSAERLKGRIVTWKSQDTSRKPPRWLPITYVEDWFAARIDAMTHNPEANKELLPKLLNELQIEEPDERILKRALTKAISRYWDKPRGKPTRFLDFITAQDWHESLPLPSGLERCPVPFKFEGSDEIHWTEARYGYLGEEWGNANLTDLFKGIEGIQWVQTTGRKENKRFLEWLGCETSPRIVTTSIRNKTKDVDVWSLPDEFGEWKRRCLANAEYVKRVYRLDHTEIDLLSQEKAVAMILLLAKNWDKYKDNKTTYGKYRRYRSRHYSSDQVDSFWWDQIKNHVTVPSINNHQDLPASKCWIPDKMTDRNLGDLLPIVDLKHFGEDKTLASKWMIKELGVRTHTQDITLEEWRELLSSVIPSLLPPEKVQMDEKSRDRISRWYETCLDILHESDNVPKDSLAGCPFLCHRGDESKYVVSEQRFVGDESEYIDVFGNDIWIIHLPARFKPAAKRLIGLSGISDEASVEVIPGKAVDNVAEGLHERLMSALPFVFVWRASQKSQAVDIMINLMKSLKTICVERVDAQISLGDLIKTVERPCGYRDEIIHISQKHMGIPAIAQALAEVLKLKSEMDFYEILMRCENDGERKAKLRSKNLSSEEIERWLREYNRGDGRDADLVQNMAGLSAPDSAGKESAATALVTGLSSTHANTGKVESSSQKEINAISTISTSDTSETGESRTSGIALKDPISHEYLLPPIPTSGTAPSGGYSATDGGSIRTSQHRQLSRDEDLAIEKVGRDLAERVLRDRGYAVEQMPQLNPGYDIKASRAGEILHIEVKAHLGRKSVVEISLPQYKEYQRCVEVGGYRWELWNIENLDQSAEGPIYVSRYAELKEEAIGARMLAIDLRNLVPMAS